MSRILHDGLGVLIMLCLFNSPLQADEGSSPLLDSTSSWVVVTANMHVAAGVHPIGAQGVPKAVVLANLKKLAVILKAADPDIVLLQEVDFGSQRSGGIDQAQYLAEALNMHASRAITLDTGTHREPLPPVLWKCRYGLATLTRQAPDRTETVTLPNPPESPDWPVSEGRALLTVRLQTRQGTSLIIGNTHLDYRQAATRRVQMTAIRSALPSDTPWILGGDFNEPLPPVVSSDAAIRQLAKTHNWPPPGIDTPTLFDLLAAAPFDLTSIAPTYPHPQPVAAIDHVFAGGSWQVSDRQVIDPRETSDHRFVRVIVAPSASAP